MPVLSALRHVELRPSDLEGWLGIRAPEAIVGYAREGDQSVVGQYLNEQGLPVVYVDGTRALLAGDGEIPLPAWARQFDHELDRLDRPDEERTPISAKTALAILKNCVLIRWLENLRLA